MAEQVVRFNADSSGAGDLITMAWLAEGYKSIGWEAEFWTNRKDYEDILDLFDMEHAGTHCCAISMSKDPAYGYAYELRVTKGEKQRVLAWSDTIPGHPPHLRPSLHIREDAHMEAQRLIGDGPPPVLLFPYANWAARAWPVAYWLDLAWGLQRAGVRTVTLFPADKTQDKESFPFYAFGYGWHTIAAIMQRSAVVVGNDSAAAHLGGTVDVPTVALVGATKNVFTHMPSVTELHVPEEYVPCVGCYYQGEKGYRAACDRQCRALMCLFPEIVADVVKRIYDQRLEASSGNHQSPSSSIA